MIHTLYVEQEALEYSRTQHIIQRFPKARVIEIARYGEVFNPRSQSFRLQKTNPSLLLAVKKEGLLLPAPLHYAIGAKENYYFSHMMNCLYDCRYCFLQGMYQSANYVVFVNYDDFFSAIADKQSALGDEAAWYFSGYDCDSLAFEPVTHFVDEALDAFAKIPNANLELRTKSTQIRPLLKREAKQHCVVAFSLSPDKIVDALEFKTPSLDKRLVAAQRLAERGWPIGLRLDPIIPVENYEQLYGQLFKRLSRALPLDSIHSVSLGPFRLPKPFHKKLIQLYPEEPLFATEYQTDGNMVSHQQTQEQKLLRFCKQELLKWLPEDKLFPCVDIL